MHTELWDKIRIGDTQAMKTLYQACYQQLYAYGFRLIADKEQTQDGIHELFCELWEKQNTLPQVSQVLAYLKICLRNKLLKQLKKGLLTQSMNNFTETENLIEFSYEDLLIAAQQDEAGKRELRLGIAQLTATQREIIKLRFFEGLDYQAIALKLNLKPRTVYNHVHTAITKLRDLLKI